MIEISSSGGYPCARAKPTSSRARAITTPRWGVPLTRTPSPRRNSSKPSSRKARNARSTVLVFTPMTAARSRAGGRRSPGFASPSAIALRICAATWSCRGVGSWWSSLAVSIVLIIIAPYSSSDSPAEAGVELRWRLVWPPVVRIGSAGATNSELQRCRRHVLLRRSSPATCPCPDGTPQNAGRGGSPLLDRDRRTHRRRASGGAGKRGHEMVPPPS